MYVINSYNGGNNNVKNFVSRIRKFRNKYAKNTIKAFKRTFTNFPLYLTVSSRLFFPTFIGQKQR